MKKFLTGVIICITAFTLFSVSSFAKENSKTEFLSYPSEAITEFNQEMLLRVSSGDDFISNKGYDETGIFVSPYWTMTFGTDEVPVYASMSYDYKLNQGVLSSYSYVWTSDYPKEISIKSKGISINNAQILPKKSNVICSVTNNSVNFSILKSGTYTCLINDDNQRYAFTVFVKEYTDEEKELLELQSKYGKSKVLVYEKGVYEEEYIDTDDYDAIFFKRGSYIRAKHLYDIKSEEEFNNLGWKRQFLSVDHKKNFVISGCGTLDFTWLDRKERDPISISMTNNSLIEGIIALNPNSWTLTSFGCDNLTIKDITIFGYRTNSDGINVCGCSNVSVSDSFIRNGDDCYSVKTTNTMFKAHDITFINCIAWSTKARCFGITGEVEEDIYNICFKDSYVIYRNATWNNDRVYSLAIAVECGNGNIDNVIFENIEINHDEGRPINCIVNGENVKNCKMTNIIFKNIDASSKLKPKFSSQGNISFSEKFFSLIARTVRNFEKQNRVTELILNACKRYYDESNFIDVTLENVKINKTPVCYENHWFTCTVQGNVDIKAF